MLTAYLTGQQIPGTTDREPPGLPLAAIGPYIDRAVLARQITHEEEQRRALVGVPERLRTRRAGEDRLRCTGQQVQAGAVAGAVRSVASGERRPFSTARSCAQSISGCAAGTASTDAVA